MSKQPPRAETLKRVQLDLPKTAVARLIDLKRRTEAASYVEVVKSSMKLHEAILNAQDKGAKLVLRLPDGTLIDYIVL